jgi:hypothetical protein
MTTRSYTTASGHRIEYEASPKVAAFLRRLEEMVEDAKVSTQEMTGLAYSSENPILDHGIFPGRGSVTRQVLDDPAYSVVTDLLFRKQLAEDGTSLEKIAVKYSMTVTEAAAELGMSAGAVRQAIAAKRIGSWLKGGQHYLNPKALTSLEIGTRNPVGPRPKPVAAAAAGGPLEVLMGSKEGATFNVRAKDRIDVDRQSGHTNHGLIARWERVVVRSVGETGSKRAWVIVPGDKENEIAFSGFYVRGRFTVASSTNNPKAADELWKTTQPE